MPAPFPSVSGLIGGGAQSLQIGPVGTRRQQRVQHLAVIGSSQPATSGSSASLLRVAPPVQSTTPPTTTGRASASLGLGHGPRSLSVALAMIGRHQSSDEESA